ncbi:TonB-dependent receptor [Granulicella sibirica]|uniref:TonB-dependent transporter Oar-like beta-barrel domain-containing protein n=1 Tax=Granulicella sibirica TaxID=2479048 RepID=A0A4Q0T840_9BACT|nr:carboxypeptidase regulatory-like domain-containing protein [Granulicella sibirica]RXH58890.1 hypothetical protein GRAN_2200 [Granulicella sibirica]
MAKRRTHLALRLILALAAIAPPAVASEYHGQILFGGLALPGATITATQGTKKLSTVSDSAGNYTFADLPDGPWKIDVEMQLFTPLHADITIAPATSPGKYDLTLLPIDQLLAQTKILKAPVTPLPAAPKAVAKKPDGSPADIPKPAEDTPRPSDGFLVNGSSSNAATTQYALSQAFGNQRPGTKGLYNGGLGLTLGNSTFNARPYSISGIQTDKPSYNLVTGLASIGGPIKIPHILPQGPNFFVAYQWSRINTAATQFGLVPTAAQRTGDLSGVATPIYNPQTGLPFANNQVPVSTQAAALLALYPLPNIPVTSTYNYQIPVLNSSHTDSLESHLDKTLGRKDQLYGTINFQSIRSGSTNLFGFTDRTSTLGLNTSINWSHRFNQRLFTYASYKFSRFRTLTTPNFDNRQNISGEANITGNNQDPANWGPPSLNFSSGISPLTDAQSAFNRNRTDAFSLSAAIYHGHHNITVGGDLRKQEFNYFTQQDPRGTFAFTGAATQGITTGSDLADFLLGTPDTSTIAFGNADKYLRQPVYDLYAADDWRILPILTINAAIRWEYGAPITEIKNRLVNLDVAPGFINVMQVLASDPVGPLTGSNYPTSLLRPDRTNFEPRVGVSWRPIPASTIVVRAGYGVYHDTSVYQSTTLALAQQAPLSTSLSVTNTPTCPLTLANGFTPCSQTTANTFAVDPNFRVGYAQTWQLSVQRDLPAALQLTATYFGAKGSHGPQEFYPNTYALGGTDPCPSCPSGFLYKTSNGSSIRNSGQIQLRRRLRSGFSASMIYTYAHSIDNDAFLGGQGHVTSSAQTEATPDPSASVAQNWRDLNAERSRSSFDQRHLLNLTGQYTSGEGLGGGGLMGGWRGRLLKEWTVVTTIAAGSGLPDNPIYFAAIPGAAAFNIIRPNPTGTPLYIHSGNVHLNAAAFTAPVAGQFGTAGRNSIEGPDSFTLNASLARTFRPSKKIFLDGRIDATNLLNHAVFTAWNTQINSTQFGVPVSANAMRSMQATLRLRF